jgi:hypothetical protein
MTLREYANFDAPGLALLAAELKKAAPLADRYDSIRI